MPEIGVVGGLGPAATADFLTRIVAATDAATDQDHADLVVLQHSTVPDRTAFITGASAEDPTPFLTRDARRLEELGVAAIVMPCNTATAFVEAMRAAVAIPVVDIVDAAVEDAVGRGWRSFAVLATDGTRAARTYDRSAAAHGVEAVYPDENTQALLTSIIYDHVKAGTAVPDGLLERAVEASLGAGVDGAILGCTELSVAAAGLRDPRVMDALDSLVRRTIALAGRTARS